MQKTKRTKKIKRKKVQKPKSLQRAEKQDQDFEMGAKTTNETKHPRWTMAGVTEKLPEILSLYKIEINAVKKLRHQTFSFL